MGTTFIIFIEPNSINKTITEAIEGINIGHRFIIVQ